MSVKTENITEKQEELTDDISHEEVESQDDDGMSSEVLAQLKAKMAQKQQKEESKMPMRVVDEKKKSLRFGVVGSGQGGSRLSEVFFELGYPAVAFNTASQDLEFIKIPEDNKYLLEYSIGGAAKDTEIGRDAAEAHRDGIAALISDKLAEAQMYLFCTSLGGGSGAGSCETMIDILAETGCPVAVITVLPMTTDDAQTKNNALQTLSKLAKMAQAKKIANLIVVDNSKIESIYTDVSQMDFFKVSNKAIVEPIDVFNKFSSQPSAFKALDSMEWAKLFTDGEGLSVYGELLVHNYEETTAIAEAVMENLNHGLLAGGFDLSQTRYAGTMIIAHPSVWQKIPSASVNYAMALIQENCPQALSVFRGLYEDDSLPTDVVKVYSFFSGLGLPTPRVEQLKKEAQEEMAKAKQRDQGRNLNLQLDTGVEESVSQADQVRNMIKKKSSTFAKNFTGLKDLRKK